MELAVIGIRRPRAREVLATASADDPAAAPDVLSDPAGERLVA